jgi:dihydroxy-acid dehydratase
MDGGLIAIVENGDLLEINVPDRRLNVDLSEDEIARRMEEWAPPEPKGVSGFLALYAQMALPAEEGAAMQKWNVSSS